MVFLDRAISLKAYLFRSLPNRRRLPLSKNKVKKKTKGHQHDSKENTEPYDPRAILTANAVFPYPASCENVSSYHMGPHGSYAGF